MNDLTNITGFALIAVIAACWRQVQAFFQRIRSLIMVQASITGDASRAVSNYCIKNFRRSPFGDRLFRSGSAFVRPRNRVQEICWERPPMHPILFFDGWKPILLGGMTGNNQSNFPEDGTCTIIVPRWFIDIEKLIVKALDVHNDQSGNSTRERSRFRIKKVVGMSRGAFGSQQGHPVMAPSLPSGSGENRDNFLGWNREDIGPPLSENPLEGLAIPKELDSLVQEFQHWKDSEKWFRDRQIPWRRGWLLYGKPGTGKTSLIRAIAQKFDVPVWQFDLSSLSNEEMNTNWREMQEEAPVIALFEDLDAVFNGRENVTGETGGGLTFDCLLNCLSGIETSDGVFNIVTTNHVELLDDALGLPKNGVSTRPGRLDRAVEVPALDDDCRLRVATRILRDWPELIKQAMIGSEGYTGAQMTEKCVQMALERYWKPS